MFELISKLFVFAVNAFLQAIRSIISSSTQFMTGTDVADYVLLTGKNKSDFGYLISTLMSNETFISTFKTMGVGISSIFLFIAILELLSKDQLTTESLVKKMAFWVISIAFILNADTLSHMLCVLIDSFSRYIESSLIASATAINGDVAGLEKNIVIGLCADGATIGNAVNIWMLAGTLTVISAISGGILNVSILFFAISRGLELTLRTILMPIPLAFITQDGWQGAGGRYIRKYLAVLSQGVCVILITIMLKTFSLSLVVGKLLESAGANNDPDAVKLAEKVMSHKSFSGVDYASMIAEALMAGQIKKLSGVLDVSLPGLAATNGILGTTTNDVLTGSHGVTKDLRDGIWRMVFSQLAVGFACVGLISKSMQICNDVWGV